MPPLLLPVSGLAAKASLAAALLAPVAPVVGGDRLDLWGPLPRGPHAVGFKVKDARDPTRRLPGTSTPRPIQISIWYPAREAQGAAMTYADYVRLGASERTLGPPTPVAAQEAVDGYRRFLMAQGAPASAAERFLAAGMVANGDAEPAAGRFPLVVMATGNGGAAPDLALLGEYLASHGYVAATSPSQARLGDAMRTEADVLPSATAQARDLAVIVRQLGSLASVDRGPIGLVGYSFGGRSALLLAGREPRVCGFVSLDSGIATKAGGAWLSAGRLDRSTVRTPILHVFEDRDDFVTPDLRLLASLRRSDRRLLRVSDLGHFELITYGMASALLPDLSPDAGSRRVGEKLRAVFAYVEAFLDASLKHDPLASRFLDRPPSDNGFAPGLLTPIRMTPGP